jgi:hypothetical protein
LRPPSRTTTRAACASASDEARPGSAVPRPERLSEPPNLERLKKAVESSFGTIDLLDVLKEADYLTDLTGPFTSVASREVTRRSTVRRRLLLALFGLGTNIGIKQIAAGEHGVALRIVSPSAR